MLNRILVWLCCSLSMSAVYAASYPVRLGNEVVTIEYTQHGPGKNFVHVHQNERTALKAARAVVKSQGGSILTLKHHGARNIVFCLRCVRYEFDPNRMFTDAGIRKSLTQFGPYSRRAHVTVRRLADKVKALLPKQGKLIAVHNNEEYSMRDYYPGKPLASEAGALYINRHHFYRNFYLVTQKKDYLRLKKLQFNSVLQAGTPEDDGSLSVYLASRSYVNVEAGYNQLAMQMNMLRKA